MTIWYDCLNHKKIGTERATCTRTTAMGYNIANVYLSIEYCSIEYLHAMPCLWCMQLATKTFLYHITNMSPFIKKVRHVNLICNKETDERSRFPPISTRKGFLKKKKKKCKMLGRNDVQWHRRRLQMPPQWSVSATGKFLPDPKSDHYFIPEFLSKIYQSHSCEFKATKNTEYISIYLSLLVRRR